MDSYSRRGFMRLGAATTVVGVAALSSANAQQVTEHSWSEAESPTEEALNDAVDTSEGPFACGADGNVVARRDDGWELVVEYGPQARSRRLTGIDVTDDGRAVWFVGGSGVIGEYNVTTQTLTNYSAPMEMTSTWEDCAVRGTAGENERLYFVNGSGELLVGTRQESGAVEYNDVIEPGGGSTIPGIDFNGRESGHVCSTSQFVAETADGGESWEQIGIGFAGGSFFDIASQGEQDVNVAAGPGIIYRYDGFRWTPHVVDDDREAIRAIDRDGSKGIAAGDNGKIYDRQSAGQWRQFRTDVETPLEGAARGDTFDVAVGGGGTILEREAESIDGDVEDDEENADDMNSMTGTRAANALSSKSLSVEQYVEGEWVTIGRL